MKLIRLTDRRLTAVLSRSFSRHITADHKGRGICARDCALHQPIFPSELTIIVNLEKIARCLLKKDIATRSAYTYTNLVSHGAREREI